MLDNILMCIIGLLHLLETAQRVVNISITWANFFVLIYFRDTCLLHLSILIVLPHLYQFLFFSCMFLSLSLFLFLSFFPFPFSWNIYVFGCFPFSFPTLFLCPLFKMKRTHLLRRHHRVNYWLRWRSGKLPIIMALDRKIKQQYSGRFAIGQISLSFQDRI